MKHRTCHFGLEPSTVLSRSSDKIEDNSSSWDLCSSRSKMLARYINSSSSNTGTKRSLVGLLLVVLALAVVVSTSDLLLSIAPAFSFLGACVAVSLLNLCAGSGIKESGLGRKCCSCKNEPWS